MAHLDVLVVGAGPVGLTAAAELARYGLRVRIIDQAAARTDKSKALVVWPRTLEHLDRAGLAAAFLATGQKETRGHFFQVGREIATVQLDAVETPFPFALMVPQSDTERLLEEHLATQGIHVERGTTLAGFTQDHNGVTATLSSGAGNETVTAAWMIGADGAHSTVRHALNATFEGTTLPSDWVLGDVQLQGPAQPAGVELHLHPEGVLGLFPMPHNRWRVIANTAGLAHADPSLADLQHILDTRDGRGLRAAAPVWLSGFHINERRVSNFRHGRVFLAGDAAHVHSPAGGQGMNTGMQDAFNLAWKLAAIAHGRVSEAGAETLLASYTAERAPVAAAVLRGSGLLTRMATLDQAWLRAVRNAAIHALTGFDFVQHTLAENITELAVAYPDSPLNSGAPFGATPRPGERAPVAAGEPPVSQGHDPRFVLFADNDANARQLIACYPDLFEPTARPRLAEDCIAIVRPDGYVGFVGRCTEWPAADSYLGRLVWPQA